MTRVLFGKRKATPGLAAMMALLLGLSSAGGAQAATLYGQDIPYVLLMHLGAFDARMGPRLLALYKSLGVSFVSLEEAQAHPFYAADLTASPAVAPVTFESAMTAKGLPVPPLALNLAALDGVCR